MHTYSIDRDLRVKVAIYIFIFSGLLSILLNDCFADIIRNAVLELEKSRFGNVMKFLKWFEAYKNILSVSFWYALLTWFYNNKAWKWKIFKVLHGIPDLNGNWVGNLTSSFNEKIIPMEMIIKQSWNKIAIQTRYKETDSLSNSNVAAIHVEGSGSAKIYFGYLNESYNVSDKMQSHAGYNILTLLNDEEIKGRYFNDRENPNPILKGGNKGTFKLKKSGN